MIVFPQATAETTQELSPEDIIEILNKTRPNFAKKISDQEQKEILAQLK